MEADQIGLVVIGRNEGERLKRCLRSIPTAYQVVYVDSGSSDGSVAYARSVGAIIVELDNCLGFTAARARNAGWRRLLEHDPTIKLVQFVDGDCEIAAHWLSEAASAIWADERLGVVFGRRRERFPERSIYNRMCDDEWNVPIGLVSACGGDALFRVSALSKAGGYNDDLIAGEEPDLCLRLGREGWLVRRIDAEMTLHDADILSFGRWWKRAQRGGFAYAEHVLRHGANGLPSWRRGLLSIVFWGIALPLTAIVAGLVLALYSPISAALIPLGLILAYAGQFLRIALRKLKTGVSSSFAFAYAALLMAGKFAQASGVLQCWMSRLRNRRQGLIEYK